MNVVAQYPPDYSLKTGDPGANYFNLKDSIFNYIESMPDGTEKEKYSRGFNRWNFWWRDKIATNGDSTSFGKFSNGYNFYNQLFTSAICDGSTNYLSNWTVFGPIQYHEANMGIVVAVQNHPNQLSFPNKMYIGTTNSGIWRTNDITAANPIWVNLTNSSNLPGIGVNSILIDPLPNGSPQQYHDIYIATGLTRGEGKFGIGILKSSNDGDTWYQTGLSPAPNTLESFEKIIAMPRVIPTDPLTLFAISNKSCYSSTDAGATWTDLNMPQLGHHPDYPEFKAIDIEYDPQDPNTIYVSGRYLLKYDILTNIWTDKTFSTSLFLTHGVANEPWFGIELCQSAGNSYAMYGEIDILPQFPRTVYLDKLDNGSWTNTRTYTGTHESFSPFYLGFFEMSPVDPNIIYVEGFDEIWTNHYHTCNTNYRVVIKSIDGGTSFFRAGYYWAYDFYNGTSMHGDIRCMKIISSTVGNNGLTDRLIIGGDGGVHYANGAIVNGSGCTSGSNYQTLNWKNANGTGLSIAQFFGIAGIKNMPNFIIGGTQDNGAWAKNNDWNIACGNGTGFGDAYLAVTDHSVPTKCYVGYGSGMRISTDYGQTYPNSIPYPIPFNSLSTSPFEIDINNQIYCATKNVYKRIANNWSNPISSFSNGKNIRVLKISESNPNAAFLSFDGDLISYSNCLDKLYFTNNLNSGSPTWIDVGQHISSSSSMSSLNGCQISDILIDPYNENRIWISMSQFSTNGNYRVIYYDNSTQTFTDYSDGLPEYPTYSLAFQKGIIKDAIYVGTDVGVYYRNWQMFLNSEPWECFNKNLPKSQITDLVINECAGKIRASTYGYSIWESSLHNPNIAINSNTNWTSPEVVTADVTITNNCKLTISTIVYINAGKKIVVTPGCTLEVNLGHLTSNCNEMWSGIYVMPGGTVEIINNSIIENAEYGIYAHHTSAIQSKIRVVNSELRSNYIGIYIEPNSTSLNNIKILVNNSHLTCPHPLINSININPIGQQTFAGIVLNDITSTIGNIVNTQNEFTDLNNGIVCHRSITTVKNSKFKNIQPDLAYSNTHYSGTAVYADGHASTYLLNVDCSNIPSFLDCKIGIQSDGVPVMIFRNHMVNVSHGILLYYLPRGSVSQVDLNSIECYESGIENYWPEDVQLLEIYQNNIIVNNPLTTSGIGIGDYDIRNIRNINIVDNDISVISGNSGIQMYGTSGHNVKENNLDLTNAVSDFYSGINVGACSENAVSCNHVNGNTPTDNIRQYGFIFSLSPLNYVECNQSFNISRAFEFNGDCNMKDKFSGNEIGYNFIGLECAYSPVMDAQNFRGNAWLNGTFANNDAAVLFGNPANSIFWVDPSPNTNFLPASVFPNSGWFFSSIGVTFDCIMSNSCPDIGGGGTQGLTASNFKVSVASDTYSPDEFIEESKYISKRGLYKSIIEFPFLTSDSLISDFYDTYQDSTVGKFSNIEDEMNNIETTVQNDSIIISNGDSSIKQFVNELEINDSLYTLGFLNETVYLANEGNIKDQINIVSNTVKNLTANLQIEKEQNADEVKILNDNIEINKQFEENEKKINDIYLSTISRQNHVFSVDQKITLESIIYQCPFAGGSAVYLARAMYRMINPTVVYEDNSTCSQLGLFRKKQQVINKINDSYVYPSPTDKYIILVYSIFNEKKTEIDIYNSKMEFVKREYLEFNEGQKFINVETLTSGIYIYTIIQDNQVLSGGKFNVVR